MSATACHHFGPAQPIDRPAAAVIDTNVALDLLAFHDARVAPLMAALEAGEITWLASAYMRDELAIVAARSVFDSYGLDRPQVLATFDRLARTVGQPGAGCHTLRCRDSADQAFIDLALATGARCLLTHDRDLLSLARHAARMGLLILTPMAWAAGRSSAMTAA